MCAPVAGAVRCRAACAGGLAVRRGVRADHRRVRCRDGHQCRPYERPTLARRAFHAALNGVNPSGQRRVVIRIGAAPEVSCSRSECRACRRAVHTNTKPKFCPSAVALAVVNLCCAGLEDPAPGRTVGQPDMRVPELEAEQVEAEGDRVHAEERQRADGDVGAEVRTPPTPRGSVYPS
jgi:hypothetical protein